MDILEEVAVEPAELIATCRDLVSRLETISTTNLPAGEADYRYSKIFRHVKMALKLASEMESVSPIEGMFPDFKGELAAIISQHLGSGGDSTPSQAPVAASDPAARVKGAAAGFHGDTRSLALPELIGCLSLQRKDGVLTVTGANETISVWFAKGDLVHAISNNNPSGSRLGEILVQQGVLSADELNAYLSLLTGTGARLGDMLRREKIVTFEQVRTAIEVQIRTIFYRLYEMADARYCFYEGLPDDLDEQIRLDATHLLLESARRLDEEREFGPCGRPEA